MSDNAISLPTTVHVPLEARTYAKGLLERKGHDNPPKPISSIDLENLYRQSISGVQATLAAKSDDAVADEAAENCIDVDVFGEIL